MIASFKNKTFLITGGYGFIGSSFGTKTFKFTSKNCSFIRTPSNSWRLKDILKYIETYEIDIRDKNKYKMQ